jgi:hypothetical protein
MAESTGFVLAAGGIVIANEALFAPLATNKPTWQNLNWRLVPATAILALVLAGIEKVNEPFGKSLGMLVLLSILIIPVGNAPTPIQNISKVVLGK